MEILFLPRGSGGGSEADSGGRRLETGQEEALYLPGGAVGRSEADSGGRRLETGQEEAQHGYF